MYADVAFIDTYWAARPHNALAAVWSGATAENKAGAALESTSFCDAEFGAYYIGFKKAQTQDWQFPRDGGKNSDGSSIDLIDADGLVVEDTPLALKNACAELSARAISGALAPDVKGDEQVKKLDKGLGSLKKSIEYFDRNSQSGRSQNSYGMVAGILHPILNGSQPENGGGDWAWR